MDFVPQPEEAKKFGTAKWFRWHIYKYPNVFMIALPVPFILIKYVHLYYTRTKEMNEGTYNPGVLQNKYVVCRSNDFMAETTPKRYLN